MARTLAQRTHHQALRPAEWRSAHYEAQLMRLANSYWPGGLSYPGLLGEVKENWAALGTAIHQEMEAAARYRWEPVGDARLRGHAWDLIVTDDPIQPPRQMTQAEAREAVQCFT